MRPEFWLFLTLTAPSLYACTPAQQSRLRAANEAGAILCEAAPAAVREAELRGVSVEDLCQLREVLAAFQGEALKAQEAACAKAGLP